MVVKRKYVVHAVPCFRVTPNSDPFHSLIFNDRLQMLGRLEAAIWSAMRNKVMSSEHPGPEKDTEGHLGKEGAYNVIMSDIMEDKSSLPSQERPVDSCCCCPPEIPCILAIVGQIRISMMQVRGHDEPVGDCEPWYEIKFHHRNRWI
jgi:hypothetical protein